MSYIVLTAVLLAFVASGLVNKAVDVWFSDQIDHVMRDSYEVARMQHAGHITLAVNSARAISHEIFREDMLLPEQRDLLVAAMARKRVEFGVAGIEVYSAKMETLTKSLDPEIPAGVLDLPIGQLVLQAINGKQEANTVQEAQTGRLVRAAAPVAASGRRNEVGGVVVVDAYVPESLLAKMDGIGRQYEEYKQIKAMKNPIKAGAYLFVAVITMLILFGATWFGFYVARSITVPIQRLATRGMTVTIRYGDYETAAGRESFRSAVESETLLREAAQARLDRLYQRRLPLRFLGVELAPLVPPEREPTLFPDAEEERQRRLLEVKDAIRRRFGFTSLLQGDTLPLTGRLDHDRENFRLRTPCLTR